MNDELNAPAAAPTHNSQRERICANCRWWVEWTKADYFHLRSTREQVGNCVRLAPRLCDAARAEDGAPTQRTKWPTTRASQFCGEYRNPAPSPRENAESGETDPAAAAITSPTSDHAQPDEAHHGHA